MRSIFKPRGLLSKEALTPRSNSNIEVLVFVVGRKPANAKKTLGPRREPTTLNPHETASTGIEHG